MEEQKILTQKKIRKNKTRATVFFLISEHYYLIQLKILQNLYLMIYFFWKRLDRCSDAEEHR